MEKQAMKYAKLIKQIQKIQYHDWNKTSILDKLILSELGSIALEAEVEDYDPISMLGDDTKDAPHYHGYSHDQFIECITRLKIKID